MAPTLLPSPPTAKSGHTAAASHTPQPGFPLLCQGCCFGYLNKKKVELDLKFPFLEFLLGTRPCERERRARRGQVEAECELGTAGQRVRPGCSVHSELARAGRPSPVPGGRRRKSGGSPWLGVGSLSRQGPLLPRATDDAERAAASAGNAAAPGPEGLGGPGRGWAGLQGAPEGVLARAWVRGEAGAGESSPKGQIARVLLPARSPAPALPLLQGLWP